MMRSIERLRRRLSVPSVLPLAILIAAVHSPTDPVRKTGGTPMPSNRYAGVLPVPTSSTIASSSPNRLDSLLDLHRDARAERGRVLYGAGHENKAATTKAHHRQCSAHIASARTSSTSPTS